MSKTLIVVDMQNDFVTGSLANPAAQAIVKPICEYIEKARLSEEIDHIILTRDTHQLDYLETPEGKALPVEHCIEGTAGWCVVDEIQKSLKKVVGGYGKADHPIRYDYINKPTFGYKNWETCLAGFDDEIVIVGTVTSICVLANAVILKAKFPETKITVLKDLCADINQESHEAALAVMKNQQINIE